MGEKELREPHLADCKRGDVLAMTTGLLPCPFCGPGQSEVDLWFDEVAHRWRVGCGRCGCSTGISPRDKTEAPAIAAWNTRAPPEQPADAVREAERRVIEVANLEYAVMKKRWSNPGEFARVAEETRVVRDQFNIAVEALAAVRGAGGGNG